MADKNLYLAERLSLAEKHYFHELELREKLRNSVALPLGLLNVFGILGYFVWKQLSNLPDLFWLIGLIGLILTIFVGAIGVIYLCKSVFWYENKHLAFADALEDYLAELYEDNPNEPEKAYMKWQEYLIERYSKSAGHNGANNDKRSNNLYAAMVFITLAFLLLVTMFIVLSFGITSFQRFS